MIPSTHAHLHVAAITHPGMRGKNNEDRYKVSSFITGEADRTPSLFAIVSDGIGGHRAGERAAEMAVTLISHAIGESQADDPTNILAQAVTSASQAIFDEASGDLSKKGMGATCICAWVIGDRLFMVAVGDSRLYLLRSGTILQLNIDHTWIQEAIEHGAITPEQARGHPNAHVIRRYLGSPVPVMPDFRIRLNPSESDAESAGNQGLQLLPDDVLLLCSDGLHDLVEEREILQVIASQNLEQALENLVNMANDRGGHDNITIVAMQTREKVAAQEFTAPTVIDAAKPTDTHPNEITQAIRRPRPAVVEPAVQRAPASSPSRRLIWLTCGGLLVIALFVVLTAGALGMLSNLELPLPGDAATHTPSATITATVTTTRGLPTLPGFITTPVPQSTGSGGPFITLPAPGSPTPDYTPWPTNTRPPSSR